jgi:SAM-dependent methyltransferase
LVFAQRRHFIEKTPGRDTRAGKNKNSQGGEMTHTDYLDYLLTKDEDYEAMQIEQAKKALALLPKGSKILDVGAGFGTFAKYANNSWFVVDAVEPSRIHRMILSGFCRNCYSSLDDVWMQYDAVWCHGALEHIPDPEYALEKIRSHVKPEGYVFLMVPLELGLWWLAHVVWVCSFGLFNRNSILLDQHVNYYSARTFMRLLRKTGLLPVSSTLLPFLSGRRLLRKVVSWILGKHRADSFLYVTSTRYLFEERKENK